MSSKHALFFLLVLACSASGVAQPSWIRQGNIYEVNVRQYTASGTLEDFNRNMDRLRAMGVQTLWFMPMNPISRVARKGTLGSYYAVADYNQINPEFGTIDDWTKTVTLAHAKGFHVIMDWVPNHTGADNRWMTAHPDFYIRDSAGKPAVAFTWDDTRQLDYGNPEMQDSMIAAMKFWLTRSDIDGFRCDVAWNVPASFWKRCIPELRKIKNVFMLAEGDSAYLPESGFDAVYPWHMFHQMIEVAKGAQPASSLDSLRKWQNGFYPAGTMQLYFTSNHDENSWNSSDFATFPGASHAPFAVLTQTMQGSVPLIYSSQEEPVLRAIPFFEKDTMTFTSLKRAPFYKTLLTLRRNDPALAADASFRKIDAGDARAVYAYVRQKAGHRLLVILNLSGAEQTIRLNDPKLYFQAMNVFMGKNEKLSAKPWKIEPWGYAVYSFAPAVNR